MTGRDEGTCWGGDTTTLAVTTPAGLEGEARQELRRALRGARFRSLFFKGNLLVSADLPEAEAVASIAEAQTHCVASVTPVQRRAAISSHPDSASAVAEAAAGIGRISPGETFIVRCRRRGKHDWSSRELESAVAARLAAMTGGIGEYEAATDWQVTVQVYQDIAYVGVNRPACLLTRTPLKQRKYRPGERPLNRAQWKLREALATFGIEFPPGGRALDLGSAPGGWATVLAAVAEEVVAVDPAALDPEVAKLPNLRHLRCRAEALADCREMQGRFDLMTSDVNREPAESAGIMCALAPLLKPGAPAIMTVKYTTRHRQQHEREAREVLSAEYEEIRLRRLPHNARETTAVMRRKRGEGGDAEVLAQDRRGEGAGKSEGERRK
jgi:tRNA(Ser,Leu) C12 N-acetylase TAN1